MRERLVKLAGPASSRGNRGAQRDHVQSGFTQNSALQGINVFDFENLRRLMSQIGQIMDRRLATGVKLKSQFTRRGELLCKANQQQPLIREPII